MGSRCSSREVPPVWRVMKSGGRRWSQPTEAGRRLIVDAVQQSARGSVRRWRRGGGETRREARVAEEKAAASAEEEA